MRFSICIPAYNVEKYVNECLDSLERQSFKDFEVIIVDDGSTDATSKMIDEYASKHDNVVVIHNQHQGLISARRTAIKKSRGDYIMFLDSDDFLNNNCLITIADEISKHDSDLIIFAFNYFNNNYKPSIIKDLSNSNNDKIIFVKYFLAGKLNYLFTKVVKRSIMDINNSYAQYYSYNMGEDIIQSTHLIKHAKNIIYIDKPLYNYRLLSGMTCKYHYNILSHSKRIINYLKNEFNNCSLINDKDLLYFTSINILQFTYSAYTNISFSNYINLDELKSIIDDDDFRNAFKLCKNDNFKSLLNIKQIFILYMIYFRIFPILYMCLALKKYFRKQN